MHLTPEQLKYLPPAPVTFKHEGTEMKGVLRYSPGAADLTWHLLVNNFYWGQLVYTVRGWSFTSNHKKLEHLSEEFGSVIVAWVDAQALP